MRCTVVCEPGSVTYGVCACTCEVRAPRILLLMTHPGVGAPRTQTTVNGRHGATTELTGHCLCPLTPLSDVGRHQRMARALRSLSIRRLERCWLHPWRVPLTPTALLVQPVVPPRRRVEHHGPSVRAGHKIVVPYHAPLGECGAPRVGVTLAACGVHHLVAKREGDLPPKAREPRRRRAGATLALVGVPLDHLLDGPPDDCLARRRRGGSLPLRPLSVPAEHLLGGRKLHALASALGALGVPMDHFLRRPELLADRPHSTRRAGGPLAPRRRTPPPADRECTDEKPNGRRGASS